MIDNVQHLMVEFVKDADSGGFNWSSLFSILGTILGFIFTAIGAIVGFFIAQWKWGKSFQQKEKQFNKKLELSEIEFKKDTKEFEKNIELKKVEIQNIINHQLLEIRNKYSEILLEKRMEIYPELIKITQDIGKKLPNKTQLEITEYNDKKYNKLRKWLKRYGGSLYFDEKTTGKSFYKLMHTMNLDTIVKKLNIKKENLILDDKKLKSIREKRDIFRKMLHNEMRVLQIHEKSTHKSLQS